VPRAATVWAVELAKEIEPDEVKGTLELSDTALLFTPSDEGLPVLRIPLTDIQKVRRLRGSPVLMVERALPAGTRRTAFYFAQPPPLGALLGTAPPERPSGLGAFRSPKRKARRDNVNYLGVSNRDKKPVLAEWVQAVRDAMGRSGSGRGQATAQG
jgi:hypothetical protein